MQVNLKWKQNAKLSKNGSVTDYSRLLHTSVATVCASKVQSHVTQTIGQASKIHPDQI